MGKVVTAYTTGEQATYTGGGDTFTGILLTLSQDVQWGPTYMYNGGNLNQARATVYDSLNRQVVYTTFSESYKYFPYGMISAGGRALVFDPSKFDNSGQDLTLGASYKLVIDYGFLSVYDASQMGSQLSKQVNVIDAITIPFTYTTATAPTLSSSVPADGATVASTASNLVLNFGEWIQAGTGNIVLTNTVSNWDTRTIPVTDTTQISISESTLTINTTADLLAGAHYAITMASGVLKDMAGNAFAGITSATTLDFNVAPPAYALSASAGSVDEGASVTFTVTTTNVPVNTVLGYTLSGAGITSADIGGAALTGTTTVGAGGQATITLNLSTDQSTEGPETLTATISGQSAAVTINDTSTDLTAPSRVSASVNGALLTLTYSEPLDASRQANLASFTVNVNGLNRQVLNVAESGSTVTLTLSAPAAPADSVLISYTDPSAGNDPFATQDLAGNDAASFAGQSVSNLTSGASSSAPVLVGASFTEPASGTSSISLVFDQAMQMPSTTISAPTWFKNGTTPISLIGTPAVNGGTLTFSTDTLLKSGDFVTANFSGNGYFRSSANVWAQSSAGVTIGGSGNTSAGQGPQGAPVFGNGGEDKLTGNWDAQLIGGAGSDTLIASGGNTKIFLSDGGTPASDTVSFVDSFGSRVGWTTSVFGFDVTGASNNDKLGMPSSIIATDTSLANGVDSGTLRSHSISRGIASFYSTEAVGTPLLINPGNFKDTIRYLSQNITTAGTAVGFAVDTDNSGSADSLAIFEQNADPIIDYQFLVVLRGVVGASLGTSAQQNVVQLVDTIAPDLRGGSFTQSGLVIYLSEPIATADMTGLSIKQGQGATLTPLTLGSTTISGNALILKTGVALSPGDYVLLEITDPTHISATDLGGNTLSPDPKGLVMATANAVVDLSGLANGVTILALEDGNNQFVGTRGDDGIFGGAGRDTISGGPGNDMIQARSGADSLDGGSGADTFVFYAGDSPLAVFSDQGSVGLNTGDSFNFTDGVDIISGGFTIGGPEGDQVAFYNRSAEAFFGNPMSVAPSDGLVTDQHYYVVRGRYAAGKFSVDTSAGTDTLIVCDGDPGSGVTQTGIVLSGIAPNQLTLSGSRIYPTTSSITDSIPPTLTSSSPTDNASAVAIGSNLTLSFSEPIKAGTGNVVLTNTANASDTRSISVTDSVQVAISGSTLTIDPAAYLLPGAHYALTLAPGVIKDLAGNDFAGITTSTALDFDTAPGGKTSYAPGQTLIDLGSYGKLITPVQVDGNHWYYYWDVSGDGTAEGTGLLNSGRDDVLRPFLDSLFIQDINGNNSPTGISNETYRYATLNGVKVALPTYGGPVSASGVAVQAQDHTLQAGTAIGSVPASGGSSAINNTYNDMLAIWDAYNGAGTGNTLNGTPPNWGSGNYWSATPSAAAYARLSSSDGLVILENYGSNTTNLIALEVLSPPSSGTPSGTLQGIVYDWKNHSLMSGVSLAASSGNNPPEGSNAPIQFKNIVWGSDGVGKAEVWVHAATAISNFDIEVTLSGVSSKAFTHSLGANWFVFSNPVNGALSISGLANIGTGETIPAGDFKLGDLSFNSGTARQIDLHLDFGQAGSVLSKAYGLSLARETTGTDGHFSIGSMQAGSTALSATRSISDLGNAVNSADALAALKIAVGINPNPDPDGTGPRLAPDVSPYQIMAANVTGTEGRVTSADALDILRMAVKLPSAPASEWMFVEETRDFYDEVAGKFTLDRTHANWDPKLGTTPSSTGQVNLVGVLKGDVDGSWQAPAGSGDLDVIAPNYFSTLAHTLGVPESQWGL